MIRSISVFIRIIFFLTFFVAVSPAIADPPFPPAQHGNGGNQPAGGGAPIGDGMFLLLALSAAYGTRKAYKSHHEEEES